MRAGVCLQYRRNLQVGAFLSMFVYTTAAWAQTFGWSQINDFTKPFFGGASLTVLAMAAAGTLIGFALTPPLEKRKNLYILIPANTFMSAWTLVLMQEWGYLTVSPIALPPLAGVTAAFGVVIIPALFKPDVTGVAIDAIKGLIGRIFNRPPPGGTQ